MPLTKASAIPNATSKSFTCRLITLNKTTTIGYVDYTFTFSVPEDVKPTISSITISDSTGYNSTYGEYVQYKSKPQIKFNSVAGAQGSSIKYYKVKIGSQSTIVSTKSTITAPALQSYGSVVVQAWVIDSRGRSSGVWKNTSGNTPSISVEQYWNPSLGSISIERCNSNGTENDNGTAVKFTYNWSFASVNSKNTKTIGFQYYDGTSWVTLGTVTPNAYKGSGGVNVFSNVSFSVNSSYQLQMYAKDKFTTKTFTTSGISAAIKLMCFGSDHKSVAIGRASPQAGHFNVALPTVIENGRSCGYAYVGEGQDGYVCFLHVVITNQYKDSPISVKLARRGDNSPTYVTIRFKAEDSSDPSLDTFTYFINSFNADTRRVYARKSATSTWDFYIEKSKAHDCISIEDLTYDFNIHDNTTITMPCTFTTGIPSGYIQAKNVFAHVHMNLANNNWINPATNTEQNWLYLDGIAPETAFAPIMGAHTNNNNAWSFGVIGEKVLINRYSKALIATGNNDYTGQIHYNVEDGNLFLENGVYMNNRFGASRYALMSNSNMIVASGTVVVKTSAANGCATYFTKSKIRDLVGYPSADVSEARTFILLNNGDHGATAAANGTYTNFYATWVDDHFTIVCSPSVNNDMQIRANYVIFQKV